MRGLWRHASESGRPPAPIMGGRRAAFCPAISVDYGDMTAHRRSTMSAPIEKKRWNTCCPKSCEQSPRRWNRSRKCPNTRQARASAGAGFADSSASGGTDLASSAAFSKNSSHRNDPADCDDKTSMRRRSKAKAACRQRERLLRRPRQKPKHK